ncbi:S24 family peptidase [Sphingobacterium faecale]|uniref:Helix-turn-helix transcriptional regulator n=1 Tax=Sphingobacterium faecale TaxID=2803775 RepID=A0ABS1R5H1_9SPHI|nr:helix-turn-helix transcriptional regulator [Sphingobacterium faecale]MBL1409958.1 helix-turn-helix transcriptional regulator [Sphingobacterium faecale]
MSNWGRLDQVIQYLGLNVNSFSKEIGLNRAERLYQIKKGNYDISKNLAGIIVSRFPELNEAWLLTGEGTMLKVAEGSPKIPLYSFSLDDFNTDVSQMQVVEELEIPILSGSDFAFVHQGDSMSPEIEHGSMVFVKQVDKDAIVFGDIYLIISEKMNIVRFIRGLDDKSWRLVAKNATDFDDLIIDILQVKAVYKVKGVLSMISM